MIDHRRCLTAGISALVTAVLLPVGVQAAWTPAVPLTGPAVQLGLVASGQPGLVAVAGTAVDGSLIAAGHPPGGAFGIPAVAGAGTDDFPAVIGHGGAIAALDGGRPTVRRLRPDGSVSVPVAVGGADDTIIGRPAVAPGGALLVLVSDAEGDAELWRQAADGHPAAPLATINVADGAAVADIAATAADQFVVGLAAPNVNEAPGVRLRTLIVTGTTGVAGAPIETTLASGDVVNELQVVLGPQPVLVYTLGTAAGSAVKVAAVAAPAPLTLAIADGETTALDGVRGVATGTAFAISWTLSSDGGNATTGFAVLPSSVQGGCRGSIGFEVADVVDRGGPVLVGLDADGAVGIVQADAGCVTSPPVFSTPVADAGDLSAAVDVDGTVLAMVGRGEAGAAAVLADDVTPPVLGELSAASIVRSGEAFSVAVDAADPWGLGSVVWTVDGRSVAQGPTATIAGLDAGPHRLEATATNAAGLITERGLDISARDDQHAPISPVPTSPASTSAVPLLPLNLTGLAVDPRCIRYGAPETGQRRRLSFSFGLSDAASVRLTIQRRLNSRAMRVCPTRSTRGRAGRLGTPLVVNVTSGPGRGATTIGDEGQAIAARAARARPPRSRLTLTRPLKPGSRRFVLAQSPTTLAPGTYVATATATASDGRVSRVTTVKFWVLRSTASR